MSETLFKIFGVAVICVFLSMILKKSSPDASTLIKMVAGVILAAACVSFVSPVVSYVRELCGMSGAESSVSSGVGVLLQALAVATLSHVCSSICRDCGETSLAYYAELGGKIEILILSLPLLRQIVDMAVSLCG